MLGDRYFGSFFMLAILMQRDVDGLFRMYQGRKFDFRRGRRLGVEDHLVTWAKPQRPDWMDEETYAQIPDEITVRELRFEVEQPGFRVDNVVLVTTMLDATMYTKDELADLYLQRWNVELDLRSIKDVLQMDVLRCKSPEMVEKEIWMHLLAYNLIRGVMAQAAAAHEKRPRQLSFKGTLQTITAFQEAMRRAAPADREFLLQAMLRAIAQQQVGDRFGRAEPRARTNVVLQESQTPMFRAGAGTKAHLRSLSRLTRTKRAHRAKSRSSGQSFQREWLDRRRGFDTLVHYWYCDHSVRIITQESAPRARIMPAYPRHEIVAAGEVGIYHCIARCVRRAFLCGDDPLTGKNHDHRKEWIRASSRSSHPFSLSRFAAML